MEIGLVILIVLFVILLVGLLLVITVILWRYYNPVQIVNAPGLGKEDTSVPNHLTFPSNYVLDKKVVILYSYCESNEIRKGNLLYFLKNGFFQNHSLIDYVFIVNGISSVQLPNEADNVRVIQRPNKGRDFAAWGDALSSIDISSYKYFIFINDSVRGPIVPLYLDQTFNWVESFTSRLNDFTKVVGCTINLEKSPHVQSYAWATDDEFLHRLMNANIFHPPENVGVMTYIEATEQMVSSLALQSGFNLDCFMSHYQGWNWQQMFLNAKENGYYLDPFHKTLPSQNPTGFAQLHPYESMFFKYKSAPNFLFQFYHLE